MSPENINSSERPHDNDAEQQPSQNEINKKLGGSALSQTTNKRIPPEGDPRLNKILHADDEISRELNTENVQNYLKEIGIDPDLAGTLLSSGVFDVVDNHAYRLSLWQRKDEKGQPCLESTTRDMIGHSSSSNHKYKIFEYDDILAVYDSKLLFEDRHYVMDEAPYDEEMSFTKYKIETDRIALIESKTGKPIALGEYNYDAPADLAHTDSSIENINSESLVDGMGKFDFQIIDPEGFEELANKQVESSPIINGGKESLTRQEEAEKRKELQAKQKGEIRDKEAELDKNIENEIIKSGVLESIIDYAKNKRLIMKFIKNNKGHINMIESPMGNYQMSTDLKKELLNLPDGMALKTRLYGPAEDEREYSVLNDKGKKIGVLDGRE